MTDTNQLPEPELGYIKTDKSNQPAFSARQMREAMLVCGAQNAESDPQAPLSLTAAPQQAEVTDDIRPEDFTVDVVVKPMGGFAPVNTQGVRVTHNPTGISVTCDVARSQHTNRHQAFEKLRTILALRPAAVPMTGAALTERARIVDLIEGRACMHSGPHRLTLELNQLAEVIKSGLGWLEYERYKHHGITTQAKKETP